MKKFSLEKWFHAQTERYAKRGLLGCSGYKETADGFVEGFCEELKKPREERDDDD